MSNELKEMTGEQLLDVYGPGREDSERGQYLHLSLDDVRAELLRRLKGERAAPSINKDWYESMLTVLDKLGIVRTPIPGFELFKGEFWNNGSADAARKAIKLILGRQNNIPWSDVREEDVDSYIREAARLPGSEAVASIWRGQCMHGVNLAAPCELCATHFMKPREVMPTVPKNKPESSSGAATQATSSEVEGGVACPICETLRDIIGGLIATYETSDHADETVEGPAHPDEACVICWAERTLAGLPSKSTSSISQEPVEGGVACPKCGGRDLTIWVRGNDNAVIVQCPCHRTSDEGVCNRIEDFARFFRSIPSATRKILSNARMVGGKLRMNLKDAATLNPDGFNAESVSQLLAEWDEANRELIELESRPAPSLSQDPNELFCDECELPLQMESCSRVRACVPCRNKAIAAAPRPQGDGCTLQPQFMDDAQARRHYANRLQVVNTERNFILKEYPKFIGNAEVFEKPRGDGCTERIAELETALALLNKDRKYADDNCYTCKLPTSSLAGNPSKWSIWLPFHGGNGKVHCYHMGCVTEAIHQQGQGDGWIRCALDSMPEEMDRVWLWVSTIEGPQTYIGGFAIEGRLVTLSDGHRVWTHNDADSLVENGYMRVTYWRPLPAPPTESEGGK